MTSNRLGAVLGRSRTVRGLREDLRLLRARRAPQPPPEPSPEERARDQVAAYTAAHEVRNLQIGAGRTLLPGWLSTDLRPKRPEVLALDATRPFPIEDGTFDHVYVEHMIEHVTWRQGQRMLAECRRVLRPGGVLRVATPDLAVLVALYEGRTGEDGEHYVRWVTRRYLDGIEHQHPVFVINNAMRNWGHTFLYDSEVLTLALEEAGLREVRRVDFGESEHAALRGVESHALAVSNDRAVRFETMVHEARRVA